MALEGSQDEQHENVKLYLNREIEKTENNLRFQEQVGGNHCRIDVRRC